MNGEAWWAAVHGVAQNWIRLKQLSSKAEEYIEEYINKFQSIQYFLSMFSGDQEHQLSHGDMVESIIFR